MTEKTSIQRCQRQRTPLLLVSSSSAILLLLLQIALCDARSFRNTGLTKGFSSLGVTTRQNKEEDLIDADFDDFFDTFPPTTEAYWLDSSPTTLPDPWPPTSAPTFMPSAKPSAEPSQAPTSKEPTMSPTKTPPQPTLEPTLSPSGAPSVSPSTSPSLEPTKEPEEEKPEEEGNVISTAATTTQMPTFSPTTFSSTTVSPEEEKQEAEIFSAPNVTDIIDDKDDEADSEADTIPVTQESDSDNDNEMKSNNTTGESNNTTTEVPGEGDAGEPEDDMETVHNETDSSPDLDGVFSDSDNNNNNTTVMDASTEALPNITSNETVPTTNNDDNMTDTAVPSATEAPTEAETTTTVTDEDEDGTLITGQISLQLNGIQQEFPQDTRRIFLSSAEQFIRQSSEGTVKNIRVSLIYQRVVTANSQRLRRHLQQQDDVLSVDLAVEGLRYQQIANLQDFQEDFMVWLRELFNVKGAEFVQLLQETAEIEQEFFFDRLVSVEAMSPMVPVTLPTMAPTYILAPTDPTASNGSGSKWDDIPLVVIIGVAVGAFILLILIIGITKMYCFSSKKNSNRRSSSRDRSKQPQGNLAIDPSTSMPSSMEDNTSIPAPQRVALSNSNDSSNRFNRRPSSQGLGAAEDNMSVASSNTGSYLYTNSANHHNHFGRGSLQDMDSQSQMGGTFADYSVMDNMSYAYSLEPGMMEPSVAGVPQTVLSSAASATDYSAYPGGAESSVASTTTGISQFTFMKQLSQKYNSKSNRTINAKTTDIIAPPGKLGLVIDTTLDGPVVHKVNPGSALEGKLKPGDIIVAIDDVDTRAMSAASITALMVKTAKQRRKLSIICAENS